MTALKCTIMMLEPQKATDYIIIGAGVIGLSVAWRLARRGANVTLVERGEIARESSWAAAGMLSPFGENHAPGPMLDFGVNSLRLYPRFVEELSQDTGHAPRVYDRGMLRLAFCDADKIDRIYSANLAKSHGFESEWLDGDQVRKLEPGVGDRGLGGVLSPSEVHLEPRALCDALLMAARNRGVRVLPFTEVCGFDKGEGGQIIGVRSSAGILTAEKYVICAGAWSGSFKDELGIEIPVCPRKGQVIMVEMPDGSVPFSHSLYMHRTYLVPRGGQILIGATQEDVGFDKTLTETAKHELFDNACAIVPLLREAKIVDHWAGFRPATADSLPIIGTVPAHQNAYLCTGHLRNGILLAPITAETVVSELLDSESRIPAEFRPERFAA